MIGRHFAKVAFAVGGGLVALHLVMRALGLVVHVAVVTGSVPTPESWILGPAYILVYLLAVTVAPILLLAATFDVAVRRLAQRGVLGVLGATASRRLPSRRLAARSL